MLEVALTFFVAATVMTVGVVAYALRMHGAGYWRENYGRACAQLDASRDREGELLDILRLPKLIGDVMTIKRGAQAMIACDNCVDASHVYDWLDDILHEALLLDPKPREDPGVD